MSEDPDVKDEDEGYCSEQTADLTSDDSDLEERTQLDVVRFSRCYVKTYRHHDCFEAGNDDENNLQSVHDLRRTGYQYAIFETLDRPGYLDIPHTNHKKPKVVFNQVELPSDYQSALQT